MNDEQLKRAFRAMEPYGMPTAWRKFSSAMTQTANARTEMYVQAIKERDAALAEVQRLREALTPSAETKAAYIGEFSFQFPTWSESGEEVVMTPTVPWVTIKGIMAAIRARALVSPP